MEAWLKTLLTSPAFLVTWIVLAVISLALLIWDLRHKNPEIAGLMRWVWILTVAYSGPLGLAIYFYAGRKQMARDSLWRRGFRSVAHCYSGCGLGEIIGVIVTVGLLALGTYWVAAITFLCAYAIGFVMTLGPLMQAGESFGEALWDTFTSETASIVVMEAVAIGVDLWLAGQARMGNPLFWASLIVSLTVGLIAAYPVNLLLIRFGIKSGMGSPKDAAA